MSDKLYRWVKASERLPEINSTICAKILDSNEEIHYCHLFYRGNNLYERRYPKDTVTIPPERVEWLSEIEADQDELWKDVHGLALKYAVGEIETTGDFINILKSKFHLTPKQ